MQGETPMISVVVPAYNRESTIAQTLDSLLAQTHAGWEVIVVDDGSSDATAERVEEYARRDERVRLCRQENKGVSAARNAGIARASHPWLFFLDADDWIVPTAFAALLQAASGSPGKIDAVYAGYVRVDEKGRETRERRPAHAEDLFPVFTQMCAFAIHACLVRTDLVRAIGGFDETLVTCEDWDLWQRIARSGARFAAIPNYIAYYGMRAKSASANGARMLEDGLRVIARGHAEDPRLTDVNPLHRHGAADSARPLTEAYFICYAAGLVMAQGDDARWMLDALGDARPSGIDAGGVAETLFLAVPNGRATNAEEWPEFPPAVLERCREFIDALAGWMGDKWLAFGARRALERLMLGAVEGPMPRTVGAWHLMEIDCAGDPPGHLYVGAEVERVVCSVRFGSHDLGTVELAVCDGWIPPRVLADRIAEELAWDLIGLLLARDVHPQLEIDRAGAAVRVARNGVTLAEGEVPAGTQFDQWLRGQVDWTLLLQEVLGNDTWTGEDFYSDRPQARTWPRRKAGDAPVAVELSGPLPSIYCREGVAIGATLAGVPLLTLRLRAQRGRVQAHRIRKAILTRLGFEFCRAVTREWILAPAAPGLSIREVLAAAARGRSPAEAPPPTWAGGSRPRDLVPGWNSALAEFVPAGAAALVIGRRASGAEGTAASRYAILPAASREAVLAAALQSDDPALEVGDGEPGCVAYAPCAQWDRSSTGHHEADDASLLTNLEFERTFATRPDPWNYASDYEQVKYEQTLSLVPDGVRRALEVGCAEGAFTARLAECVPSVLGCDVSVVALSAAARRCNRLPGVSFAQLDLFEDKLPEGYDLIVCSETLYYASSEDRLARTARRFAQALAAGGLLLTANANALVDDEGAPGFDWDVPFGAGRIEQSILATGFFEIADEIRTAPYRVQLYRRRARRRLLPARSPAARSDLVPTGEMSKEAGERYRPRGGAVRREEEVPPSVAEPKLPILMYHRIAADGTEETKRWRTHPDDFRRQLEFLRGAGYYSLSFEGWRAAANARRVLPGKPIVITFDDGYEEFQREVAPLLIEHGFRASIFVVSELVGQTNAWDAELGETLSLMDWSEIEQLAVEGFEIGSHTRRHLPLVTLDQEQLADDLARSKRTLEQRLGQPVRSLSYPFGLHDATVESVAGACGYEHAVTTDEWSASWSDSLLALPRLEVAGTDSIDDFAAMLRA